MARAPRIPKAEITGPYGWALKRFSRKSLGDVPEAAGVMWHHKRLLRDAMAIGRKVQGWKELDADLTAYAHMSVAALVGCSWCLDFNYFMAQHEGLDLAKASQVPRWRASSVFSPLERDVMEYAEAMSVTPPTVTDELSARLLEQLGAPALLELTSKVAFANFSTRSNVALGIEAQGFSAACEVPLAAPSPAPAVREVASA